MKKRLLSILLCLCLILSGMTVFGAKPFIPSYDYYENGETYYGFFDEDSFYEDDGYLSVCLNVSTPDGGMSGSGAKAGTFTKVNGRTYASLSQLEAAIPANIPVQVKIEEIQISEYGYTNGATEINFDATPTTYTQKTYSASTGTLAGLSADLPIFYCLVDDYGGEVWYNWYYPYLDENHYYDLNVYDYGIVITNMYAQNNNQATLCYIGTQTVPNGKMLSNIRVETWADYQLTGYYGELYNEAGTKIQSQSGVLDEWSNGTITFTDLPAEEGTYTINLWGLSGNAVKTPVYSYEFEKEALNFYQGTVTRIEDNSTDWGQYAYVYAQLDGESWERGFYCRLPVEVGDTVCTTVSQLTSVMPVGSYVQIAQGGHESAFRIGTAKPKVDHYGIISQFKQTSDSCAVQMILPDGTTADYTVPLTVDAGGETCASLAEVYDYLKRNAGATTAFIVDGDEITALYISEGEGSVYTDLTYSTSDEAFDSLPNSAKKLPVYYQYKKDYETEWKYYPPYLDGNHTYDVTVYDYGIVITRMTASDHPATVAAYTTRVYINENMKVCLAVDMLAEGSDIRYFSGNLSDYENDVHMYESGDMHGDGTIIFEDIPNRDATYDVYFNLQGRYGETTSPYYFIKVEVEEIPVPTLMIQESKMVSEWSSTVIMKVKNTSTGDVSEVTCANPVYINGERYVSAKEILAHLPVGREIQVATNENGEIATILFETKETIHYGRVKKTKENGNNMDMTMVAPDGTEQVYTFTETSWFNRHFISMWELEGFEEYHCPYIAYAVEGDTIISMWTEQLFDETTYYNKEYSASSKKFLDIPEEAEGLPIYYNLDGTHHQPILDENHEYDLKIYTYAIVIVDMEAKDKPATIKYLDPTAETNNSFLQDISVAFAPVYDGTDGVMKAQLLDNKGAVITETSQPLTTEAEQTVTFPNRPNENADYRIKAWIENGNGETISCKYQTKFSTVKDEVIYGVVSEYEMSTDESGNPCVVLKIMIPGLDEPVYVTCPLGTVVNGVKVMSADDLDKAFRTITLVKVVRRDGSSPRVRTVKTVQFLTTPEISGTVISSNVYIRSEVSTAISGTAYVSLYSKDHVLKALATQPFTIEPGESQEPVPVQVEGTTYAKGDYLKVVCMNSMGVPMCDMMTVNIQTAD